MSIRRLSALRSAAGGRGAGLFASVCAVCAASAASRSECGSLAGGACPGRPGCSWMNRVRRFGAGLIGAAFLVVAAPVYADSGTFVITFTNANSASGNYTTPEGDTGTFTITRSSATGYAAAGAPGSATALFSVSGSTGIQLFNNTDNGTLPTTTDSFVVTLTLNPSQGSRPPIIEVSQQTTQLGGNSEAAKVTFTYSGTGASQAILAANPAVTLSGTNGTPMAGQTTEQVRQFGGGCPNPLIYGGSPGGIPQTGTSLALCPPMAAGAAIASGTDVQLLGVDNAVSAYRVDLRNATTVTVSYTGNMRGNGGQSVVQQRSTGETFNEWLGFGVRSGARLNLAKAWVNGRAGDAVTVTTTGGTNNATLTSAAPTATNGAFAGVFQGDQVVLPAETFTAGSAANYNITVACTGGSPLASGPVGRTLTIGSSTADTTCTYTNSRIAQQVNLAKIWGAGATAGHTAGATTTGGTNNATFNSTAPATNTTGAAVTMYAGDAVTLPAETFAGGATAASYAAAVACTGGTPLASTTLPRTITIGASTTATTCTYTNTANKPTMQVSKNSSGGTGTFAFTGNNGYAGATVTTLQPGVYTLSTATSLTAANVATTVTETVPSGWVVREDPTYGCYDMTPNTKIAAATFSGSTYTIPAASVLANTQIRCHFLNTRTATVTVTKVSNGGTGTFSFSGSNGIANHSITTTQAGGSGTTGAVQTLSAAGVATTITEGAPPAGYTLTNIACTGLGAGGTATPDLASRTITLNAAATATGSAIACTFTNQAALGVTLKKAWTNGKTNDAVDLTITGGSGAVAGSSTVGGSSTDATATANAGATVTLTEAFRAGTTGSNYTTTLACTDANNAAVTVSGTGLSRTITMPATAVTCTYTNSRIAQQLNLAKSWGAGATSGHTAGATTTGGSNNATFNSTAPSTGLSGPAVTVYAGDAVTLPAETFGGGATAANYSAAVACTGGTTLASTTTLPQTVTIAASTTATTCTYTNSVATTGVTLKKSWTNGKTNDAVSLSITGGSGAVGGSSVAGGASTDATATANVGATIALVESFTTGAASNYTTTLACVDANSAAVTVTGTGLSRTITMPATAVTCTYTNSRIAQQLNLAKSWSAGAIAGHTADATTTGGTANPTFSSTAPAATTGTAVTVYAGDALTLPTETFGGGATAANYGAAVACTGGTALAMATPPQSITVAASTTATTCTYTNTLNSADLAVVKTNDATSVVGGGTTTYSVTVSNRGASAVTGAVVSDTPVAGLSACQVTACTPGGACPAQPGDLLAAGGATLGTLAAGAQAMFTVTCNVNP